MTDNYRVFISFDAHVCACHFFLFQSWTFPGCEGVKHYVYFPGLMVQNAIARDGSKSFFQRLISMKCKIWIWLENTGEYEYIHIIENNMRNFNM